MSLTEKMTVVKEIFLKALPEICKTKELTFRDKITKDRYLELKSFQKLYSGSARAIREAAIKNKGLVRGHLRWLKTTEGQKARLYHVALCFLRGKKYSEVESNVEVKNKLSADKLFNTLIYFVNYNYRGSTLQDDLKKFLEN